MSKNRAEQDAQMKEAIKKELATGATPIPVNTQSQRDEELKAQIKSQLASGPAPVSQRTQADQDAQMKEAIKKELATSSVPVKTQSQRDEELKSQIKFQLASDPAPVSQKTRADQDAQTKEAIKKELATPSIPVKTQSQRDEELKSQIKSQLTSGLALTPQNSQADRDSQMKETIKKELASASAPMKTQSQSDEELKSQIKAQLAVGPSAPLHNSLEEGDEELKRKIRAELGRSPENNYQTGGVSEVSNKVEKTLPNSDQADRLQSKSDEAASDEAKAQAHAALASLRAPHGSSTRYLEQVGEGVSSRQVTSDPDAGAILSIASAGSRQSTSEKGRPEPLEQVEVERVGAFSVATRAYGGMPAWIRQQAEQNRVSQSNDDSNLPPEMRGLSETQEQSDLPPEMRMAAPPPEASPDEIDPEVFPTAEVAPAKTEDSRKKGNLYLFIFIALVIIAGVGAGVGIALGGGDDEPTKSPESPPTPSPTSSPTLMVIPEECIGYPETQVNPKNMDANVTERYSALLDLAHNYWPDYMGPETQDDYCAPEHLALVWLANDDVAGTQEELSIMNRFLLSTIFFKTTGYAWRNNSTNWLSENSECTWSGVRCDPNGTIIELRLDKQFTYPGNETLLFGDPLSFPSEVTFMTDLRSLRLSSNRMEGTIPPSLGKLVKLEILDLSWNKFNGTFPYSYIISLVDLRVLLLENNDALQAAIPEEISQWPSIEMISIASTGVDAGWALPTQISSLPNLAVLNIGKSSLEGTIPSEIGNLSNLEFLNLMRNDKIFGSLPSEIGNLTNLKSLFLNDCRGLTGSLPTEIGNLLLLETLVLSNTALSGTLPAGIFTRTSLTSLDVTSSDISGAVVVSATNLANLTCLGLGDSLTSVALTTEGCQYDYDDSTELAACESILRESCVCCSKDKPACRSKTSIEVGNCGDDKSKLPNTTEAVAGRLELV